MSKKTAKANASKKTISKDSKKDKGITKKKKQQADACAEAVETTTETQPTITT